MAPDRSIIELLRLDELIAVLPICELIVRYPVFGRLPNAVFIQFTVTIFGIDSQEIVLE